jgi:Tfp pilus assembly protein PilP
MMRSVALVLIASFVLVNTLGAQPPATGAQKPSTPSAGQPPATGSQQPAAAAPAPPPPLETYTYQPAGRRDPFLNLLGTGSEPRTAGGKKGDGPGTMAVADISVRGVVQSKGALVAMITGPDGKTYIVHQGDKLLDGIIKAVTPQGLVILQDVTDPLSLVKQREITKLLRALEVAKE